MLRYDVQKKCAKDITPYVHDMGAQVCHQITFLTEKIF